MDLLEYQAKALFAAMGIPVLPSQPIASLQELRELKVPYPIALKSQVRAGGRGRAGGIRFANNTIDAVAAAQAIFSLPIQGECPALLLAEAKYNIEQELYLAVTLDDNARRPVLLGSTQGGMDGNLSVGTVHQVLVDGEFSPFYARRLVLKMGLRGHLVPSVSEIVQRMHALFVQNDLDLVEINPLGVDRSGELMALDGKVTVNDSALGRHPELQQLLADAIAPPRLKLVWLDAAMTGGPSGTNVSNAALSSLGPSGSGSSGSGPSSSGPSKKPTPPAIAIACNGTGLTLAALDLVCRAGGTVLGFVDIGWTAGGGRTEGLTDCLEAALEALTVTDRVRVVLLDLLGSAIAIDDAVSAIDRQARRRGWWRKDKAIDPLAQPVPTPLRPDERNRGPAIVLRVLGSPSEATQAILDQSPISLADSLEAAAKLSAVLINAPIVL
ncbi:MAG: succinate--CoA ligase subunit beta [Oscillatoriales cyanobacterium]|nr:MAG: succinate--CoA ligase subunit beta [Oscillatoriales cyanobacterium]